MTDDLRASRARRAAEAREKLTPEVLATLLFYDEMTGKLFWKRRSRKWFSSNRAHSVWNARYAGQEAFTTSDARGYKIGSIFNIGLKSHRVAFAIKTGAWPQDEVDHINGAPGDNRWSNIRAVNSQENSKNSCIPSHNTTGRVGVYRYKNRWTAGIQVLGKRIHLGYFKTFEEASVARNVAEQKYGFHENHGRKALAAENEARR